MKNPTPANPTMTDTLLFEQFATLATAPDGIARLRELILQLAVQGKLGTQEAGDEPASVLLERIKIEKKLKKNTLLSSISMDEYPFILPNGWLFCHLEDIIQISSGDALPSHKMSKNGTIPVFGGNGITGYHDSGNVSKPTLVIGRVGFYCGSIHLTPKNAWITDNAFITKFSESNIDIDFLFWLLKGSNLSRRNEATAQPVISGRKVYPIIVGLPPLAEQHRIVAKVDRLMALCDELEARQQQERGGCLRLGTASLAGLQNATHPEEFERQWAQVCDAFDLILDCPENVAVLRQTILQLVVQGRLSGDGDSAGWKKEQLENLVTKVTNGYVGPHDLFTLLQEFRIFYQNI
jgi:type I restriction enzyme S subunit